MDKTICVGDLVMKVRPNPCCGNSYLLGVPFVVATIEIASHFDACYHCRAPVGGQTYLVREGADLSISQADGAPLSCCIKIDPPALSDDATTAEPVGEVA